MSSNNKKLPLEVNDYVHLHNHSQYSLLDGLTKISPLIDYVKDCGMEAVAVTDHGTLSGIIELYKEANSKNIKPIIGMEAYIAARKFTDREASKDKPNFHLIILAMDNQGYKNLMTLSTIANLEGFYYKPRIDHDLLERYSEGLIILSGCIGGEVGDLLRQKRYEEAKKIAIWYKAVFADRYYLEVQDHGHPDHPSNWSEQQLVNEQLLKLSKELNIPAVVTCDAHYLKHQDQEAHEILLCVQTGSFYKDKKRMSLKDFQLHVTNPVDIISRWGEEYPELILNTKRIADRCMVNIELGKILIPKFPVPKGETEQTYLHKLVYQGLAWRYGQVSQDESNAITINDAKKKLSQLVLDRAEYELRVIAEMGFNGYFLIIADFIGWGKNQGIVFGPGRGSAAGSIIAYSLKITELDPLAYDLLFERFLNPDRISMPDVDIDIQDSRRSEVIEYCVKKYGLNRVANIVTFGRMAARNAIRDVARVLEVPYSEADRLAKMIPPPVQGRHIPLAVSLEHDADLKKEYQTNELAKKIFDLAVQLEGTVRSHGVHAAGVVIAPDDIVKYVPLEMAQKGVVATQYPMGPIEELGLLKMDFLGLSNLTTIKNALRIIKRVYHDDIDINSISLTDQLTFDLLKKADTTGVFQLESAGMKRYLKELQPSCFEDIVAMVALYRPGPMQFIDDFLSRKKGTKPITYPDPSMENSLKNTYGVLVYQEQVMQISKEVCGFTGGEADTLRKAIGKKNIDMMRKMKVRMLEGAKQVSNISVDVMEQFWQQLEDFAAYCFNKSHAACYGLIAYQTAYLKAHYPAAFMAALMTSDYDDTDRLAIEISECKRMGIRVLPPDVCESFAEFAVVCSNDGSSNVLADIRFGMFAIKNVGSGAVEEILDKRKQKGTFNSLEEFLELVNCRVVNRKVMESLIKAGAFDRYGDRFTLLHNLDTIIAFSSRLQKQLASGQADLFSADSKSQNPQKADHITLQLLVPKEVYDYRQQLIWERELLGLYISQHPLEAFMTILSETTISLSSIKSDFEGKMVTIGGAVGDMREIMTKNGQKMAFVKLEDQSTAVEVILFPSNYQQTLGLWEKDRVVLIRGRVSTKDKDGHLGNEVKIIAEEAREITIQQANAYQATGKKPKIPKTNISKGGLNASPVTKKVMSLECKPEKLYLRLNSDINKELLTSLKKTIDTYSGDTDVVLVIGEGLNRQAIKLPVGITKEQSAFDNLKQLVGSENVKLH